MVGLTFAPKIQHLILTLECKFDINPRPWSAFVRCRPFLQLPGILAKALFPPACIFSWFCASHLQTGHLKDHILVGQVSVDFIFFKSVCYTILEFSNQFSLSLWSLSDNISIDQGWAPGQVLSAFCDPARKAGYRDENSEIFEFFLFNLTCFFSDAL